VVALRPQKLLSGRSKRLGWNLFLKTAVESAFAFRSVGANSRFTFQRGSIKAGTGTKSLPGRAPSGGRYRCRATQSDAGGGDRRQYRLSAPEARAGHSDAGAVDWRGAVFHRFQDRARGSPKGLRYGIGPKRVAEAVTSPTKSVRPSRHRRDPGKRSASGRRRGSYL
jgi:hypothetical protein